MITLSRAFNTMLDRIEAERRDSAHRALAAQEAERLRIARELHDEVGQTLTAVALRAERAAGELPAQAQALVEIVDTVHRSLDDVRRIARELRPEALDDLGLIDALISLCLRMERQGAAAGAARARRRSAAAQPRGRAGDLPRRPGGPDQRVSPRGGFQGARRAGAQGRARRADRHRRWPRPARPDAPEATGLAGMRERAILIQGQLEIDSPPGGGVEVRLTVAANDADT